MSFGLKNLTEEKTLGLKKTSNGVHDSFCYGLRNVKSNLEPSHPLEYSEKNYDLNQERMRMSILRNNQGIHAPLKLAAELRATREVGRLPFLESSNISAATLRDDDNFIDFSDILNLPEVDEQFYVPHIVMENKLGIL